jgi:hypothetical protein
MIHSEGENARHKVVEVIPAERLQATVTVASEPSARSGLP